VTLILDRQLEKAAQRGHWSRSRREERRTKLTTAVSV
jgi:hypothetical protein